MKSIKHLLTASILAIALSAKAGTLQESSPITTAPPQEEGWWFRAAPYLWLTAIDGHVSMGPYTVPVDISMHDTLKSFDMGFMGVFEAGYGRWSLGMDVLYAKTSEDITGGGTVFNSFRYEQSQWLLTPEIAYRAVDTASYRMDVFAGARVTILGADLTGRLARGGQVKVGNDLNFADPIIGLRGQAELGDQFFLRYNGDIGGFGASSRLVWQAFAGLGYHISRHADIALGYRGLGIDYSKKAFTMDTISHGPILGVEVKF